MCDETLVTLPEMAKRLELSQSMVTQLRKALWHHAVRVGRTNHYPESVVLAAIRRPTPNRGARGIAFAVGKFPPSDDLAFCPCGRAFIDDQALAAHIDRDHDGIAPEQVQARPAHTLHWKEVMEMERRGAWRNYEATNRPDVASA